MCKKLILPFDIYENLIDDKEMTAEKYDEALILTCTILHWLPIFINQEKKG